MHIPCYRKQLTALLLSLLLAVSCLLPVGAEGEIETTPVPTEEAEETTAPTETPNVNLTFQGPEETQTESAPAETETVPVETETTEEGVVYDEKAIEENPWEENAVHIYNLLVTHGFTPAAACGALGNIWRESSINPLATTETSICYGMCSWLGPEMTSLFDWCTENGYDYHTVEGQTYYLIYSMTAIQDYYFGRYGTTIHSAAEYEQMTDVAQAATEFCRAYEIPGTTPAAVFAYDTSDRQSAAEDFYNWLYLGEETTVGDLGYPVNYSTEPVLTAYTEEPITGAEALAELRLVLQPEGDGTEDTVWAEQLGVASIVLREDALSGSCTPEQVTTWLQEICLTEYAAKEPDKQTIQKDIRCDVIAGEEDTAESSGVQTDFAQNREAFQDSMTWASGRNLLTQSDGTVLTAGQSLNRRQVRELLNLWYNS